MATTTQTDELLQRWEHDGYVVVRGLIDAGEIARIREVYDRFVRDAEEANDGAKRGKIIQRNGLCSSDAQYRDWPYLAKIVEVGRLLLGDDIGFWYDQIIMKPAGNPATTPWHQDAGYWRDQTQASHRALTCWLALSDVTEQHGCMQFIPGSHKHAIVEHDDASQWSEISGALAAKVDGSKAVKVALKPGDVTLHHCRTLHFTDGNLANTPRCGLITHMAPSGDERTA